MRITLLLIGFLIFDLLLAWFLIWAIMRAGWRPLTMRYPPVDPAPDAVRRTFQSFRLGAINLGYCVHVAADEHHLHLMPARIIRWCGAEAMSVPWSAIEPGKRLIGGKWMTVSIDGRALAGPAWCLALADPDTAAPAPKGTSADDRP
ncbi:MAG: hypothetical protein SYC29_03230 [Planctomycetota bacterium]|nr:hypothetical protein [Planctomycetota bacterium]